MTKLKAGIIGLGEVAQTVHLPILQQLSSKFEISALCDISVKLLERLGEQYRVGNLYTDAVELTKQEDLDVVFVLNSDEYHTDCVVAAAENKKHILVEKPMCLTLADADKIIEARDKNNVQVMVGYMRRFAPAFIEGVEEIKKMDKINYAKVRDIIGPNIMMIEQSHNVHRFNDIPESAMEDRWTRASNMVQEAIGDAPADIRNAYRLLCGLSSHDLSAMRELIGFPKQVVSAVQWNGGGYINAIFEHDGFYTSFETGVDQQRRFDAHLEVFGETKQVKIQYNTPYIRQLPTTLSIKETVGEAFEEREIRPTFKDAYVEELEYFYDVVTQGKTPKTTPEDFKEDLKLFNMIVEKLLETSNVVKQESL
ncbi:Gfo/Idh/MocA family protein [Lederbergia citrea]|uniref:Gfo/Idh/MocA family protein n=1 Tax=Lederbergia citrea TaxID=2833581 RepID=UPI001BCA2870|nr:Gfo/Idh/MocA family oxidoreductase [Lederbergia citrea]MBS4179001.1 Gfo/Idh/MocA family oxidoreductase [Lederbergia citrea]